MRAEGLCSVFCEPDSLPVSSGVHSSQRVSQTCLLDTPYADDEAYFVTADNNELDYQMQRLMELLMYLLPVFGFEITFGQSRGEGALTSMKMRLSERRHVIRGHSCGCRAHLQTRGQLSIAPPRHARRCQAQGQLSVTYILSSGFGRPRQPSCAARYEACDSPDKLCPASFVVFGNDSCLCPVNPALSGEPLRDSICC